MHRMRCSRGQLGCGHRFTMKRAPHEYARTPRCPHCKSLHVVSAEKEAQRQRRRRKARGLICRCRAYPFPHVRGTMRFCHQHEHIAVPPNAWEIQNYQAVIETPRGNFA